MKMIVCALMLLFATPVLAADWQVNKVRGDVTQQVGGAWKPVGRGDTIPNDRYLKTGEDGRVGLMRGTETIEMEGNTQIRIKDAGAELMTSVLQDFGVVSIEAERRNVQHFSVQTRFLAAVVKGTRFTVRSDATGASVQVNRGVVQVQDTVHDLVVDIRPGQEASVTSEAPLLVDGAGAAAISVFTFNGVQVSNGTTTEVSAPGNSGNSNGRSASSNPGGNAMGSAISHAGGNGNSASSNAGGNANSASSNAGGNGNSASSNAGGNGNSASSNAGGNGNSASSNAGGNGNGNAYGLPQDDSTGNSASSNAGGNGNGLAKGRTK